MEKKVMEIPIERDGKVTLKDLFVFTSLKCNLTCSHCYVSSSPGNDTLDDMTSGDLQPFLDEAKELGVQDIYFTGGEPFANPDIGKMIMHASNVAPVTIYTNATRPLDNQLDYLIEVNTHHMQKHDKPVLLRVSFDHYMPQIHDQLYNRGLGNFEFAIHNAVLAAEGGLDIAVTTQADIYKNGVDFMVEQRFRQRFAEDGVILRDVKVLPDIPQGAHAGLAGRVNDKPITPVEFEASGVKAENLMCGSGRTLIKYDGVTHVYPCTILVPSSKEAIPDFAKYRMGESLSESFKVEQPLDHPSCRAYCVSGKQSCGN